MGGLEKPGRFSIPRRPAWHPAVGLGEEGGWVAPEERSSGMDRMGRYLSVRRARLRRSSPRAGRTCPFRPAVGGGLGRPNAVFGVAADAGCAEENVRSGGRWGDARGVLGAAWLLRYGATRAEAGSLPCRCPKSPGCGEACRQPLYSSRLGMQHSRSFRQIGPVFTDRQPLASTRRENGRAGYRSARRTPAFGRRGRGEPEEPLQRGRSVKVVRDASVGDSRVSVWVERVGMRCGKHPPQRPPENG